MEVTAANEDCSGKIDGKGHSRNEIIGCIREFNDAFIEECFNNTKASSKNNVKKNKI